MCLDRFFEFREHIGRKGAHIADEQKTPAPGNEAERNFQAARPVDAHARRVDAEPRLNVFDEGLPVALISGQPPCLAEVNEPLMTIELPDHFAVAHGRAIEGIEPAPVNEWSAAVRNRIEVPVDRVAEFEVAVSEEIETPMRDTIRGDQDGLTLLDVGTGQYFRHSRIENTFEEVLSAMREEPVDTFPISTQLTVRRRRGDTDAVDPLQGLLPAAEHELRQSHPEHSPQRALRFVSSFRELHDQARIARSR